MRRSHDPRRPLPYADARKSSRLLLRSPLIRLSALLSQLTAVYVLQLTVANWQADGIGYLYLLPIGLAAVWFGPIETLITATAATTATLGYYILLPRTLAVPESTSSLVLCGATYLGTGLVLANRCAALRQNAEQDHLTGLPNRRAFFHQAALLCARKQAFTVLTCDVDNLKTINDEHGHAAGDLAIREVAHQFRHALGSGAYVARVGGDEFLAITKTLPDQLTAERFQGLGGTIGIARCAPGHTDIDTAIREADKQLYRAKQLRANDRTRPTLSRTPHAA